MKDGKITYCYNVLGIPPEQRITATTPSPGKHIVVEFAKERVGQYNQSYGRLKLHIDDAVVAESEIRTMTGHFSLCGEGLCVGYDSSDPRKQRIRIRVAFHGWDDQKGGVRHRGRCLRGY